MPEPFAFVVFNNEGSGGRPAAYGGGAGHNLYRNRATVEAYVFAPNDDGMSAVLNHAETIAPLGSEVFAMIAFLAIPLM